MNGKYVVQLFFVDPIYKRPPGKRVFNVTAQGQTVLNNFDIIGDGGGGRGKADRQGIQRQRHQRHY